MRNLRLLVGVGSQDGQRLPARDADGGDVPRAPCGAGVVTPPATDAIDPRHRDGASPAGAGLRAAEGADHCPALARCGIVRRAHGPDRPREPWRAREPTDSHLLSRLMRRPRRCGLPGRRGPRAGMPRCPHASRRGGRQRGSRASAGPGASSPSNGGTDSGGRQPRPSASHAPRSQAPARSPRKANPRVTERGGRKLSSSGP